MSSKKAKAFTAIKAGELTAKSRSRRTEQLCQAIYWAIKATAGQSRSQITHTIRDDDTVVISRLIKILTQDGYQISETIQSGQTILKISWLVPS